MVLCAIPSLACQQQQSAVRCIWFCVHVISLLLFGHYNECNNITSTVTFCFDLGDFCCVTWKESSRSSSTFVDLQVAVEQQHTHKHRLKIEIRSVNPWPDQKKPGT